VVLKKVVLKGLEEAEEGLVQVESLVETEVNHPLYHFKMRINLFEIHPGRVYCCAFIFTYIISCWAKKINFNLKSKLLLKEL
jgi:hypothetical protein